MQLARQLFTASALQLLMDNAPFIVMDAGGCFPAPNQWSSTLKTGMSLPSHSGLEAVESTL
jgi:hypothetical protein